MQLVEAGLRAIGLSEQSLHFSCIPAMHLPPPRTALAREPHATAPVPGPHDAHDAARAAYAGGLYAYVPGMHKQVCSGTPDGVTATAPAETADRTRTAPAHPCESRITRAAEERLFRTCLDTASHPPPAHFLTARLPGRSPSSTDDRVPLRYCLPNAVMAAVPKPHVARGIKTIQRSNDSTIQRFNSC